MTTVAIERRMPRPIRQLPGALALGLVAYVVVYLVWLAAPFGTDEQQAFIADFAILPVDAAVIGLWVTAAMSQPIRSARRSWTILAVAMAAMIIADSMYFWLNVVVGDLPFPSVADAGYLAFYGLMVIGLMRFPAEPRTRAESARFTLDAAMIVVAGGMFVWQLVLHAVIDAVEATPLEMVLSVAYPVGDLLLLLGISVTVLRRQEAAYRRALALIALGALLFFVADMGFAVAEAEGSYLSGTWPDGLYMLATLIWAGAGWVAARDARLPREMGPTLQVGGVSPFPYLAVGLAYGLIVFVTWSTGSNATELVLGGAGLTGLVVLRQIVAVRDNIRLSLAEAARESEERFRGLIQHASDVITIIDPDGTIRYQTPSVRGLLGYDPVSLVGSSITDLVHPRDTAAVRTLADVRHDSSEPSAPIELRLRDVSGAWRDTETIAADLRAVPSVGGIVLTTRDVTERKALEARLTDQAFHDPLTGLANRLLFHDRVEQALRRAARRKTTTAVVFIDIDDFKRVNDTLGHGAGDQLLVAAAARIAGAVRSEDTPARLGGDEFAVLFEDVTDTQAIADRARHLCGLLGQPVVIESITTSMSASLGLAFASPGSDTVVGLLREADMAMYAAKEAGRNRVVAYEPSMHVALVERVSFEADLRAAVAAGGISMHLQPVFEIAGGTIVGAEALARWSHPERGMVSPAMFIPVAEETGLIVDIGRQMLLDACREASRWTVVNGSRPLAVNVNVSAVQLAGSGLVDDVRRALDISGLAPQLLTLEITESVLADTRNIHARLEELKAIGIRLSIDDFGTGFSSLSYLQTFPVDEIKIDRSFVAKLRPDDQDGHVFVRAIIELARGLGLDTVAEGIELADQLAVLRQLGCKLGQGYLVARPMEPTAFESFIARSAA